MPKKPNGKPDQALVPPGAVVSVATIPELPPLEKHPGGRRTLLTDELQAKIVEAIRNGCWDWVAAEANGVDRRTFYDWLQRGDGEHPERSQADVYVQFVHAVREARAYARRTAEIDIHQTDKLAWLMKGPGRDRPGEPGWTDRPSGEALPHITVILAHDGKV
jgi:hypothetical protein